MTLRVSVGKRKNSLRSIWLRLVSESCSISWISRGSMPKKVMGIKWFYPTKHKEMHTTKRGASDCFDTKSLPALSKYLSAYGLSVTHDEGLVIRVAIRTPSHSPSPGKSTHDHWLTRASPLWWWAISSWFTVNSPLLNGMLPFLKVAGASSITNNDSSLQRVVRHSRPELYNETVNVMLGHKEKGGETQ